MAKVKSLLAKLNLGTSVAEFDEDLENYFVETNVFRALLLDVGERRFPMLGERLGFVVLEKFDLKIAIFQKSNPRFDVWKILFPDQFKTQMPPIPQNGLGQIGNADADVVWFEKHNWVIGRLGDW